jgi:hypothetical protein
MTPHETQQIATALAAVVDAALAAVDPSGATLRRACGHLRDGLRLAEQMDAGDSDAARIVSRFLEDIESESE